MKSRGQTSWLCSRGVRAAALALALFSTFVQNAHGQNGSLFCERFAVPFGYRCGEYTTQTADGFVLVAHRLSIAFRAPSQTKSENRTTDEAPAPFSPLCIATNQEPFETIPDFVSAPQSSTMPCETTAEQPYLPNDPVSEEPYSTLLTWPARGGPPVLLMHQEFQNGDSWFLHSDDYSDQPLPFLLLDAGFDVWIGHQRATYWGHDHATLTPEDQSFWNWTWDEHAKYDMPALLELVSEETKSTVHFVGVSQSATAGAATSTMPLASRLLRSLTLIGPTIYHGNTNSITQAAWAFLFGASIDRRYHGTEFQDGAFHFSSEFPTDPISGENPIMSAALNAMSGPNCCLGSTVIKFKNGWDGTTSFKNLLHYQQGEYNHAAHAVGNLKIVFQPLVSNGTFGEDHVYTGMRTNTWQSFDYGNPLNNSIVYGMPIPPTYYPEAIPPTLPVLVIYGGQDGTAPPHGSRKFMSELQSNISGVLLPEYAHYDLFYGLNRTQDIFIPVLQFLEKQHIQ